MVHWRDRMEEGEAMVNEITTIACRHVWREVSNFIDGEVDPELRVQWKHPELATKVRHCPGVLGPSLL